MTIPPGTSDFFSTMRERHAIYLRRRAGQPWPWTDDPVMREYSITNPFRENDKTTRWLRENVRERLRSEPEVLLAIAVFRWFNRIETGQAIFSQTAMFGQDGSPLKHATAWDCRGGKARDWIQVLRASIVNYCGRGPYVTGSYIIQGWQGMNKLDGVLKCVEQFCISGYPWLDQPPDDEIGALSDDVGWREVAEMLLRQRGLIPMEHVWRWLRQFPYLGNFMAHEIVQDLRYTDLLCDAPDINTWSNPGPGAERGLARVYGRDIQGNMVSKTPKSQLIAEMRELLELSRRPEYWPQWVRGEWVTRHYDLVEDYFSAHDAWPALELHQIEMWLCEYQKIVKTRLGEGRPRGKYRPS